MIRNVAGQFARPTSPQNPFAPSSIRRYWNRHAFDFDQASLVVGLLTAAFRSACA